MSGNKGDTLFQNSDHFFWDLPLYTWELLLNGSRHESKNALSRRKKNSFILYIKLWNFDSIDKDMKYIDKPG